MTSTSNVHPQPSSQSDQTDHSDRSDQQGASSLDYDAQAQAAARSYRRLLLSKKAVEAALWVGIAVLAVIIVVAPRFSTLLIHIFNDPFASSKAYTQIAPLFLMVMALIGVWILSELMRIARRLPAKVISVETSRGLVRVAVLSLVCAIFQLIRMIAYPTLDAAISAIIGVIAAVVIATIGAWIGWKAHAQTVAHIAVLPAKSHQRL